MGREDLADADLGEGAGRLVVGLLGRHHVAGAHAARQALLRLLLLGALAHELVPAALLALLGGLLGGLLGLGVHLGLQLGVPARLARAAPLAPLLALGLPLGPEDLAVLCVVGRAEDLARRRLLHPVRLDV